MDACRRRKREWFLTMKESVKELFLLAVLVAIGWGGAHIIVHYIPNIFLMWVAVILLIVVLTLIYTVVGVASLSSNENDAIDN